MITFSGTSYLGLATHPGFLSLVKEGLDKYGTHYGGSRLSPLCPDIFEEAEAAMAEWTGAPAALLVGSGSSAGQLAARYLAHENLPLQIGPLAHPALWWPKGRKHADWNGFLTALRATPSIAFTDALDPLGIQLPPWESLLAAKPARLVVDDSHTLGWFGPQHAGSWRQLNLQTAAELLVTASLGKALALPAGILLGEKKTLDRLRELPQFGGASPPPPAFLYAWLHGQEIIAAQRRKLQAHLDDLLPTIEAVTGIRYLENFPVFGLQDHTWVEQLAQKGVRISAFRYPNEHSPMYSRIVVRADHTEEEVAFLAECLKEIGAK
ncbi:aminotransferase class I/II-fold pyridoxal phosphate-dependent enzyme [Lewinella sp. LCG006]|uniref:aminotransferase class I/II-fold pyridoxal phosphate-dependent enzyme n=1 Tax=Lewinella sp. LCG006 TaxID=3231911 RepID=UPI0034605E42